MSEISDQLIPWQTKFGRNNLPWQSTINPYLVWISEVMLQQTQVKTVLPYYQKFITTFPSVKTLALADEDEVMQLWSGLGYYARARNLHASAKIIDSKFQGKFPTILTDLLSLPGIGRSTGGAICSLAFNQKTPILDGNVKRVFTRVYGIKDWAGIPSVEQRLWEIAEKNLPETKFGKYNQALMDLGATVCVKNEPICLKCPINKSCKSFLYKWTDIIPAPKPRKEKLTKISYFYIFQCESKFLFSKKPKKGIWGGLWSFLEFKEELDVKQWVSNNLKINSFRLLEKGVMTTVFTHYKLQMHYQHIKVKNLKSKEDSLEGSWHDKDKIEEGAYPAAVKRILKKLIQDGTVL
jgi:A/G-specific adenine glycosylase